MTVIEGRAFRGCTGLESINIPSTVKKIGNEAFEGCISLTTLTIPDQVTHITFRVFKNCKNLQSITLGKGIGRIGDNIFENCINLRDIYMKAVQCPQMSLDAFDRNVPCDRITLHVPNDVVDMYKGMIPWNKFNVVGK